VETKMMEKEDVWDNIMVTKLYTFIRELWNGTMEVISVTISATCAKI
jgi:hypothetical protein